MKCPTGRSRVCTSSSTKCAKSWALRYRSAGTPRKLTIGPYPAVDLATARKRAQEALGDVAGGKDPATEKQASWGCCTGCSGNPRSAPDVAAKFVKQHVKRENGALWTAAVERYLAREILPRLGASTRIGQIRRADVRAMLNDIGDRSPNDRQSRARGHSPAFQLGR